MNLNPTTSSHGPGRKVFFVEDDPLIVEIYRKRFLQEGYEVLVAEDGLAALKMLAADKPDVVVLDLMMPKMSGADVLKFIRSQPELKSVPVIILSNSYMTDAAHDAAVAGADKALLKSRCTPKLLLSVISEIFGGAQGSVDRSVLLAVSEIYSKPAEPAKLAATPAPAPPQQRPVRELPKAEPHPAVDAKVLNDFLKHAPEAVAAMRQLYDVFVNCHDPQARALRLEDVHRKVHFFTSLASLAGCYQIAQLASALEALLLELGDRPQLLGPTTTDTMRHSVGFLSELIDYTRTAAVEPLPQASAIVIDDDVISNRLVVAALHRANFNAASASDPLKALALLQEKKFDLILLDVNMPLMDGFEFCSRLRSLDRYKKTPIIFVTCRTDLDSREQGIRSGGDDVIAKPILPIELAVKAVTHLLKARLPDRTEKKVGRF